MDEKRKLLGIIGGLGPMSSAYFYELITEHTLASRDQDHIDIILSSHATTPDRTDFILGRSDESPLPAMVADAKSLEAYGASAIVIPCNTAHYFIEEVRNSVNVPVPSIITETVLHIKKCGFKKAAILATEGTISSRSYQNEFDKYGMDYSVPDKNGQAKLMSLIYDQVKKGGIPSPEALYEVTDPLFESGCDCAILGCTELSLIGRSMTGDERFIDSLTVLASCAIKLMNHQVVGLPKSFD
ncbi:MAG: amino acid racemase [Ruminococcaceae bacterium]|nr:amino acid racemase [Oscillospiraceae bacterium]